MSFSAFLDSRRASMKELVGELKKEYEYVSVLGSDVKARSIRADRNTSNISSGRDTECGFVVKMSNGSVFFEYSLDDISGDMKALAAKISGAFALNAALKENVIDEVHLGDEPLVQSFARPSDLADYSEQQLLDFCKNTKDELLTKSEFILNAVVMIGSLEVSKLFISANRELDQHYSWVNGFMVAVYRENDKVVQVREGANGHLMGEVLKELPTLTDKLLHKAHMLTLAKPITPGVYDVITDPSITGLIAHEAFGHGVEMDQFVKDRALAKTFVGDYVASPIVNMRDGAASVLSAASYFFDDDGVLAGDTQIIKDGILVTGISDLASATQLGLPATGNGRRESSRRKAYSRMTNTFFEKGSDKLEEMIASIDHGYMLFETSNGMEDPKNWAIQCVAEYGIEIVDGKLTDNWVSPVVMSGYVPDLLKSITMVSDDFKVIGAGSCGKGYKEWVRVSDGGPALKARVKLG
ncbi:MAG: TldD/PmbA family protein [Lachnospiraceae bacterium]|nr:TldD/PmbA family protein [Lachnospiraceae bacterium]